MLNQDFNGDLHRVNGSKLIWLDDPQTIWVLQSGTIAVFAVPVEDNVIKGPRRYLFDVDIGEALFGATAAPRHPRRLLAVPLGDVELLRLNRASFSRLVADADSRVIDLVETWLKALNSVFSGIHAPIGQIKLSQPQRYSLHHGQVLQPEAATVAWIQIQQGRLRWLGLEELTLETAQIFPLSDRMWLEAEGAVQLKHSTTAQVRDTKALLSGLSQMHHHLLGYIGLLEEQEAKEYPQQLQERDRRNQLETAKAWGKLASTLGAQPATFLDDTPLLEVAGAVGRAMGIKIRPPAQSMNTKRAKEPLDAIAQASRIRTRPVLLRGEWWRQDCGPLVGYHLADKRPIALLPISATRYQMFDLADHSWTPVTATNVETLAPIAHMFYRSLPDKALNAVDLLRFALLGRMRELLIIVLAGIAAALLGMLTPQANAILIDNAIPDGDRGLLLQVGLGLLVAALGAALFRLTQGLALLRLETTSDASTQAAVWDRLLNLPLSFFRQYTTGDLQSRVSSISMVRRMLGGPTLITLVSGVFALLNLVLLFYYSWQLALVAVGFAILTFLVTTLSGVMLVRKVGPLLELQGNIFGQTVQLINGISKLRVAGAEERAFATWSEHYSRQVKLDLSTQYIEDAIALFNTVVPTLISAALFWFAFQLIEDARLAGKIGLTVGTFVAFNSAFGTFSRGVTDVSNTVTGTLQVVPQWKRAQPILDAAPEVDLHKADPGKLTGRISMDHVSFCYRNGGPLTINAVTLQAEPGEFIALVGDSGSGKSTIFRLLLGFETPEDGAIYYDGQDLAGLDVDAVRQQLGVVLQTGRIMAGSVFDNMAGSAQVTLDEAWEAARMAGLADDIAAMPMQMHTVISEGGGNLSGGQRQRLLIARALVLKPKLLLFDEATSALDNRTQAIVSQSLDALNITRIVIAHRLSTIRNADRIYVLKSGRVVQQGSFEQLKNQEGLFAQLMIRQMF